MNTEPAGLHEQTSSFVYAKPVMNGSANSSLEIELIPKKVKELTKTEKKAIILEALREKGYNDSQVSQFLEVTRSAVCQINKKVKQGTLNPLVNKARRSLKALIDGKAVGQMREVRGSDVLTACKLVLDRTDPVTIKTESTHVSLNYDLSAEDRQRYAVALGLPAIDVEFEMVGTKEVKLIPYEEANEGTNDSSKGIQTAIIESIPSEPKPSNSV